MISENVDYSDLENEIFEVYGRLRLEGVSKYQAIEYLMIMKYKLTPKIFKTIEKYDKNIFFGFTNEV
jgi:hypothetical protein